MCLLESANDRILGVDNPGQHVQPHVQYGTTCLLIRNAIGSLSCSVEWGMSSYILKCFTHMVQDGLLSGILSTASEDFVGNRNKA
jgi:hypothetical protein